MAEDASTTGYMRRYKAVSRQAAVSTYSATNISTITTSAIESYIRDYFDSNGKHRNLLAQFAPGLTKYLSDETFVPEQDPTRTKLTIARYNERLAAHPPCYVLSDSGIALKSPGFGRSISQSRMVPNQTAHCIAVMREVPITIVTAANSKSDMAILAQALHSIFYDLSNFIGSKLIHPENETDTWIVRLPMQMDAGGYDKNNMPDDPQQMMWTNTFSFTASFEDCYYVVGEDINYEASNAAVYAPSLVLPDTVTVGKRIIFSAQNLQLGMKVVTSDPGTAVVSPGSNPFEFLLLAKKPGTFDIKILNNTRKTNPYPGQSSSIQPDVVLAKTVTSTY